MRQPMRNTISAFTVGLLALFAMGAVASAAEWGSLKGRFVVDGTTAKPASIPVTKDPEYCGTKEPLVDQTVVVGKDNSLVNGVVYLRAPFGKKVDINPDYEAKLKKPVVLDNHFCSFHPHVTL